MSADEATNHALTEFIDALEQMAALLRRLYRPGLGAGVAVTFPETVGTDAETVTGTVVAHHDDAIDIERDDGEMWSLFDSELAAGVAVLEVIG